MLQPAEQVAVDQAVKSLDKVDERVTELDITLAGQEKLVTGAKIRLEAQIAEAAILEERDVKLATKIHCGGSGLVERAPKYGFGNLPSEPWHWSLARGDARLPSS